MRRVLVLLTAMSLVGALAAPAAALAAPGKVTFVAPNGVNDTANIQAALNGCSGAGRGCVVQLQAGTYYTSQLVVNDFIGTLRGAGRGATTIVALANLPVTLEWYNCLPDTTACLWPVVLNFVDGRFTVSDLSLDIPAMNSTETADPTIDIFAGINVLLVTHQDATFERIGVRGRNDDSAANGTGYNTLWGVNEWGWWTPTTAPTGSLTVADSSISTVFGAVSPGGGAASSSTTVTGNTLSNVAYGIAGAGDGRFEISHNWIGADNPDPTAVDHMGIQFGPNGHETGVAARFSIHDNVITVADTCGCGMEGIQLFDAAYGAPHWLTASIVNNPISVGSGGGLPGEWKDGIELNNTTGAMVVANTIRSTDSTHAGAAIGILGQNAYFGVTGSPAAAQNLVLGNNVRNFAPQGTPLGSTSLPGLGTSQYYLDPNTSNNLVVCTSKSDTSLDTGSGNHVLNCTPVAVPHAAVTPLVTSHAVSACQADLPALLKRQP
jgi:hypothetical protein